MRTFDFLLVIAVLAHIRYDASAEEKPFGLTTRVPWTASRVVGTPDPPAPYAVERVFPKLKFTKPVYIAQEPGTNRLFVGELSGKIYAFDRDDPEPDSRELFLDIGRELYSFSFHPKYKKNGFVFTFSPRDAKDKSKEKQSRVSRYTANRKHPRTCEADTEKTIIEWIAGGHNGGEAIIGPDGFLYISTGDSTSGSDLKKTGQGVNDLLSVIMRLDVDHDDPCKPYSIPPDNPFNKFPGARPEIWAFGFRNPWRMSFDRKTGQLWVGDVGQDLWEMIWLVQRGGNYGWSVQEGDHPFHPNQEQGPGPIQPPVVEHHHTECRSITGGYVYRGKKFRELRGVYFYGDYEYGKIWGVRYKDGKVTWQKELADTSLRIPTFAVSRDGEIYLTDHPSGELYKLIRAPEGEANAKFPRRLSETGLFASVKDHKLAPGVIPYSVNVPQWCDNAEKQRFFGLPEKTQINFGENNWGLDDNTVLAETLSLAMDTEKPDSRKHIETRILVKQQNHWLGYSYLWNDEQTDAALVEARGKDLTLSIKDPSAQKGKRQQTWHIPSRNECMACHSRAAGFVLGLKTGQLNKDHDYDGVVDNQLRALNHIGIFKKALSKPADEFEKHANPYDEKGDVTARARAYLHVNCSVCHVSDGGGNAKIQLKLSQKIEEMNLIDEVPMHGTFGLADGRIIAPGDPYASVLFYRMSKLGQGRMPHIGSKLTDEKGLEVIHNWIMQLPRSDGEKPVQRPTPQSEYASVLKSVTAVKDAPADERAKTISQILSSNRQALVLSRLVVKEPSLKSMRQEMLELAMAHSDVNVRDLFERFIPESQRVKRLGDVIDAAEILAINGNAASGSRLFSGTASQCVNCHRINDKGGNFGPDLSEIGKKYKPHELLESLIEPSKKIDPKFATHALITTSGKIITGILVERTEEQITLNILHEGKGKLVKVPVAEVDELMPQQKSLMPDRLLRDLTAQQAADLLEFLVSLTGGKAPATSENETTRKAIDERVQPVIDELDKLCRQKTIYMIGPTKAKRLAELVRDKKPKVVVECGTAVGYSGLWIARELNAAGRGKLITIEIDKDRAKQAEANFKKAGLADVVEVRVGDARKLVGEIKQFVDFLFIDCNFSNYGPCFSGIEDKLAPGAVVVADNVGVGAASMKDYLDVVRTKYQSKTESFEIDLPWGKRDAMEITVIRPKNAK